jgi:hypothetical protein
MKAIGVVVTVAGLVFAFVVLFYVGAKFSIMTGGPRAPLQPHLPKEKIFYRASDV